MKQNVLAADELHDFRMRLGKAFRGLRKAGYFARQNFLCCQSCGWSEVPEDKGNRAVFYHAQDAETVPEGVVYLAWSGDGNEISKIAKDAGLGVEWDGTDDTRILVKYLKGEKLTMSTKSKKSWWIKERHNPQFDKPYYVPEGQLSKREARAKEDTLYGTNVMLEYASEKEYNEAIVSIRQQGYNI